jgi:hypothetical protein
MLVVLGALELPIFREKLITIYPRTRCVSLENEIDADFAAIIFWTAHASIVLAHYL